KAAAQKLRGELDGSAVPIVVMTGIQTCAQSKPIQALGRAVKCVDTTSGEPNDIVASIFAQARGEPWDSPRRPGRIQARSLAASWEWPARCPRWAGAVGRTGAAAPTTPGTPGSPWPAAPT